MFKIPFFLIYLLFQPQVPLRLPCYDFITVTNLSLIFNFKNFFKKIKYLLFKFYLNYKFKIKYDEPNLLP